MKNVLKKEKNNQKWVKVATICRKGSEKGLNSDNKW